MNKIKAMAADEQAVLRMSIEGKIVTMIFSVKEKMGEPSCNLTWHVDFEGSTTEQIMLEAARAFKIDKALEWRSAKDKMNADVWQGRAFNFAEEKAKGPHKKTDIEKADADAKKLTPAERKRHLATLEALIEADEAE